MVRLARHLRKHGFATEQFGYVTFTQDYKRIARRLRSRMEDLACRAPYAVVCHSLGGVLTREALRSVEFPLPRHVIMLGTPNTRSRMAEWAMRYTPWGLFVGQAGRKLADPLFFASLPLPPVPYTVIAGTKGFRLAPVPFHGEANDTLVSVSETRLDVGERHVVLPVGHTFMMNQPSVREAIVEALKSATPE